MRYLLSITLVILVHGCMFGQKADSLRRLISNARSDTTKSLLLSSLCDELTKSDPEASLSTGRNGLLLSRKANFTKGEFRNLTSLAASFQGQATFDSAILYYRRACKVAIRRHDKDGEAEVYSGLGHSFMRKSMQDSARYFLDKGLTLAKSVSNFRVEAGIYNNYGNVYLEESRYQKALDYFIQAAKLYKTPLNDEYGECLAFSNIGNVEYRLGNYDRALDYAGQSMAIARRKNFTPSIGYAHKLLGRIYRKQKHYAEALSEYVAAQKLYQTLGDVRSVSEIQQNIGNIYFDQNKIEDALNSYQRGLITAKAIDNKMLVAYAYSAVAQAYAALNRHDDAIHYADSGIVAAQLIHSTYLVMDLYNVKSQAYEAKGDFKNALNFHKQFAQQKDTISQSENRQVAEEMQAKFDLERKEAQITLLEKDASLQRVTLQRLRAIQIAIGIALFLVIVIALLLVNRYRVNSKVKRFAEIEKVRNGIARDLHDDIGSTLSTINIISKLAMRDSDKKNAIHLHKIAEQSSLMMESMTDMVWTINPINDTLEKVIIKMKVFAGEILEPKGIEYAFDVGGPVEKIVLDADQRKNLFLIFKEAINNAAKYSQATTVNVRLRHEHAVLKLSIEDNGAGFDETLIRPGNGLGNMRNRASALQAVFALKSVLNRGTLVDLKIPLHI